MSLYQSYSFWYKQRIMSRILIFLFLFSTLQANSQYSWELAKDRDGIQVYTKTIDGSPYKASKVTSKVEGTLHAFAALFRDVDAYDKLFPDSHSPQLIERKTYKKQIHYIISEAPWPVADRDGVYQYDYRYEAGQKTLYIEMKGLPNYWEEKEGMVRIVQCDGVWTFEQLSATECQVTYEFQADPGGTVPAWLANTGVTSMPYELMLNVKKRIKLDKYKNGRVSFIP